MKNNKLVHWVITALLLLGMGACNKDSGDDSNNPGNGYNRKEMLTHLADNLIIPAYAGFASDMDALKAAADAFAASPATGTLTALRSQYQKTYISWQKVELYDFGPSVNNRNFFNIYPTDVSLLESYVGSGSYNLELLVNNKVQGFPALDYLINGVAADDAAIIVKYTSDGSASGRKKYLTEVVAKMKAKIDPVLAAWKGTYRDAFIAADGSGAGSSLSLMTNEYIMYFERFLRSGKYAIPSGAMSGTPLPESVEALYSKDMGTQLATTALQACQDFYQGKDFKTGAQGPGLNAYLKALASTNAEASTLAARIDSQFGVLKTKASSLGGSIYDAVKTNRTSVLDLYDEFQVQVRHLKVDMTSAIGISITYTDNDGD